MQLVFKRIIRAISCLTCLIFISVNYSFPLGTMPVTEKPYIKKEWEAAGRKRFAAKWDECPIGFDPFSRPENFVARPDTLPDGISEIRYADYNKIPSAWKKSPFFRNVLLKDHKYKNIQNAQYNEIENILLYAFRYYRSMEAKIPQKLLDVRIDDFVVNEEGGEIPISRIEKYNTGKYSLVIHPKFVRAWADILINDIWMKYNKTYAGADLSQKSEVQFVSLAWGIFFRIAKHEMTDLKKRTKVSKGLFRGHLTSYPPDDSEDSLFSSPELFENAKEIEANHISGRYAPVNDAFWLWFLGSYCFADPARYDNNIFSARIDWIFNSKAARRDQLPNEFPVLKEENERKETRLLEWSKSLALNVNYLFFSRHYITAKNGGIVDKRKKNLLRLYEMVARNLLQKYKKSGDGAVNALNLLKALEYNLPVYIAAGFRYSAANKGAKPLEHEDIETSLKADKIKKMDKYLDEVIKLLSMEIVGSVIDHNFLNIRDKLVAEGAMADVEQFVSDALYHYYGSSSGFLENQDALKSIKGYMRARIRDGKIDAVFDSTGKDPGVGSEADERRALNKIISEHAVRIRDMFGSGKVHEPDEKKKTFILNSVNLLHKTDIELLIPFSSLKLLPEVEEAIKRMNRIMRANGMQVLVNEYYGPDNLLRHLTEKKNEVKKIVIIDSSTRSYLSGLLAREGEADKIGAFRGARILNFMNLSASSRWQNTARSQAQILMTAILSRLIEKDSEYYNDIKSLLIDLLSDTFVSGNVDVSRFIDNLACEEDPSTGISAIMERLRYFVAQRRAISLVKTLHKELLSMEYFWTFA